MASYFRVAHCLDYRGYFMPLILSDEVIIKPLASGVFHLSLSLFLSPSRKGALEKKPITIHTEVKYATHACKRFFLKIILTGISDVFIEFMNHDAL